MRETSTIEFKELVTNSFLKTVSAFANYNGGKIFFGIDNNGNIKGISNIMQACLDIENKINDSIIPQPHYSLEILDADKIIKLTINSGLQKPYMYKSKAYKRNDTSTIEVDRLELSRLILEGKNIRFEELTCSNQNLTFDILSKYLKRHIKIQEFNKDTLKTLNLYSEKYGYNNAAGILADKNKFPGIDIIKFGENINIIEKRLKFENISILQLYDKALNAYKDYYQYEKIEGTNRKIIEKVPESAFREAVSNALIHRTWDIDSQIKISMFDDKIEVISPGGLPYGISKDEYLSGKLSILRNRDLANVFYRLGFVEIFGTGIIRIKQMYKVNLVQPIFEIAENSIKVILPIYEEAINLTNDEIIVYRILSRTVLKQISDIEPYVPFGKSKTTKLLKDMAEKGYIDIKGRGRGTKYKVK